MAVRARQLGPFAVRSTEILIAEGGEEHHTLRRSVGALDLTALGVGAIIGTGIFVVIGEGAGEAGPAVTVSFVLAAFTCLFSALSYAELASSIPIAGSAYTYTYATLGEVVAWIIGWDLVLEYGISVAAVAVGWGANLNSFLDTAFGVQIPQALATSPEFGGTFNLPAVAIVLAVTALLALVRGAAAVRAAGARRRRRRRLPDGQRRLRVPRPARAPRAGAGRGGRRRLHPPRRARPHLPRQHRGPAAAGLGLPGGGGAEGPARAPAAGPAHHRRGVRRHPRGPPGARLRRDARAAKRGAAAAAERGAAEVGGVRAGDRARRRGGLRGTHARPLPALPRRRPRRPGDRVEATGELLEGDVVDALATVDRRDADLLVCGSRGYGPLRRVLLGGVSSRLLRRAACPLLVVPRQGTV